MKFYCYECKKQVDYILLDGYPFGDRLLEGILFEISINEQGELVANVEKSAESYIENLNKEKWLEEAVGYVLSEEDSGEIAWAECPICGGSVALKDEDWKPEDDMEKMKNLIDKVKKDENEKPVKAKELKIMTCDEFKKVMDKELK